MTKPHPPIVEVVPKVKDQTVIVQDGNEVAVNGKLCVSGFWSFMVWLCSPFVKSGPALILATGILFFIGYEADKLGLPLMEKYGKYVEGQTQFTKSVEDGMKSQTKATEDLRVMTAAIAKRVDDDVAASREIAEKGSGPAREVLQLMQQATMLMEPVPELRMEQNKLIGELLKTQQEVLQVLKDAGARPKNPPKPPSGGAPMS